MNNWVPEGREAPSTIAIATAAALLAGTVGYLIGQASSIGLFSGTASRKKSTRGKKKSQGWPNNFDVKIHPDSSDEELMKHLNGGHKDREPKDPGAEDDEEEEEEEEEEDDSTDEHEEEDVHGGLKTFADNTEECKLVLCVRTDLGMGKGTSFSAPSPATFAFLPPHTHTRTYTHWNGGKTLTPPIPPFFMTQAK